jgi:hypothetical protein
MRHSFPVALIFLAALLFSVPARADCAGPAGPEGQVMYNVTYKTMQFCNGTDWIAMGGGGSTIGADAILESMLKSVNAPTDEYCLTYETTTGDFEWQTCGAGGVTADSLDFTEFKDAMALDAGTNIAVSGTNELSITNSGTGLSLRVNDSAGDTSPFVIDDAGAVGIGTAAPADLLTVNTSTNDVGITVQGASSVSGNTTPLKFADTSGTVHARIGIAGTAGTLSSSSSSYDLVFRAESQNILFSPTGGGAAAMFIGSNSNVGIGTTGPQSLFHVGTGGYAQFEKTFAGAPTGTDCDAAAELGRVTVDTTNGRWYVCTGTGGWKYTAIGTSGGAADNLGDHTATTNINLGANYISRAGTAAGLSLDASNNATFSGDLTITGDDLFMATNTAGRVLIADGTNFNPTAVTGDISITGAGVTAIGADKVTEAMLKSVNAPTDEYCLTYETTTGDFEWQTCGAGGDNLGDHTATTNINLGANYISRAGTAAGLSFDASNNATLSGDLTISGDDLFMATNTAGLLLIADGTNFNPTAVTGDISITGAGVTAIGADKVTEAMLKSVNAPTDEYCLTYETTTGDFEWQACGGGPTVYNAGSSTSINWSNGTQQYTTANCGAFTFSNMVDGGNYTLSVRGSTSGTCSFSHSGLTFRMPPGHTSSLASTYTLYAFARMGTVVHVSWMRGV